MTLLESQQSLIPAGVYKRWYIPVPTQCTYICTPIYLAYTITHSLTLPTMTYSQTSAHFPIPLDQPSLHLSTTLSNYTSQHSSERITIGMLVLSNVCTCSVRITELNGAVTNLLLFWFYPWWKMAIVGVRLIGRPHWMLQKEKKRIQ